MPLIGLLVFVAGLCLLPVTETDLFFRLARGREFLATGHLPRTNLFSFTYPDAPYLDPAWLFDVGTAALFRLGGFPAVVIGKTAILLFTFFLAYRLARQQGARPAATALLLAFAALAMRERLVERPHIFSLLGCVVVWWALGHLRENKAFWLIPLTVLWANFHAGAFLAPILVAQALPFAIVRKQAFARLAVLTLALGVCLLATPVGTGIFRYLLLHGNIYDLHPVDEFRAMTFRSDGVAIAFFLACAGILAWKRTDLETALPTALMMILAARNVRFVAETAILLALATAPLFSQVLAPLERRFRRLEILVGAAFLVTAIAPRLGNAQGFSLDLDRSDLPDEALRFVEQHGLRDRMYNDFETGAYLIWEGFPRYRVFTDPRLPAYPEDFHRLLGRMDIPHGEWTAAMDRLGVESALIDYAGLNRRVGYFGPNDWALVYRHANRRVFVRRLPRWNGLIATYEIPATFTFTVEEGAATFPIASPPNGSPVPACEWELRLADLIFDLDQGKPKRSLAHVALALASPAGCLSAARESAAAAWLGAEELAAHHYEEARAHLERALALAPAETTQLANLALTQEGLGLTDDARKTWRKIADLVPGSPLGKKAAARAER